MNITLCETFRSLAFQAHGRLAQARLVGYQPLEETFTDLNLLELKVRHPLEIYTHPFTKPKEGANGADWEWWLTNSTRTNWLGLRIQAKILELKSNTFAHLHYKSGNPKTYQLHKLVSDAAKGGLTPLYCFYSHIPTMGPSISNHCCHSFFNAPESYGCAISSADHVANLQASNEANDLKSVISKAAPWHCLVCCRGYADHDLPENAWAYMQNTFDGIANVDTTISRGPRSQPPRYVYAAMEGAA